MSTMASVGLRLLAIAGALGCALLGEDFLGSVPLVAILLFAILAWSQARGDPARAHAAAEQVYYLGYVTTMCVFAGVLLQVAMSNGTLENPTRLLFLTALAVATTALGFLAMSVIKEAAGPSDSSGGLPPAEQQHLQRLMAQLSTAMTSTVSRVEEFEATIGRVNAKLLEGGQSITQLTDRARGGHQAIQALVEVCRTAGESVGALKRQISRFDSGVAEFGQASAAGATAAKEFMDTITELHQVLDHFVALLERRIEVESALEEVER